MGEWTPLSIIKHTWKLKGIFMTVLALLVCLPLALDEKPESRCAYVIIVMAILWLTEAIPIPATALIPIFLLPMVGVQKAKTVSGAYVTDTSMLFFGGLILAVAVEEWNLHKRIALSILRIVGSQPNIVMLGLMLPTWFLSMWISNTAATAMMVPIIQAVIDQMGEVNREGDEMIGEENPTFNTDSPDQVNGEVVKSEKIEIQDLGSRENVELQVKVPPYLPDDDPGRSYKVQGAGRPSLSTARGERLHLNRMAKGFSLCVAYAANMGGVATLTGTPPNLVLKGAVDQLYDDYGESGEKLTFASWMGFAFPLSLIGLILAWGWLQLLFLRCSCCRKTDKRKRNAVKATILKEYNALGKMTMAEIEVLVVFCILVLLWLFRSPPNIDGWGEIFKTDEKGGQYVSDSTGAILISVLLFILPAKKPSVFCWSDSADRPKYVPLLTWKAVERKVPWGVILLLGGGFAIAGASKASGLSESVGNELKGLADKEAWIMNLILSLLVAGATELTSNTATATLLMPILRSLGISTGVHPMYLMITGAVACSFAFMLPVATPPNAIVFSCGYLTIPDMALAGLPMNFIAVLALNVAINTWGVSMFDLNTFPSLFENELTTAATTTMNPCNFTVTPAAAG